MKEFTPTYLYIKQHTKTGLKYFGKTTGTEEWLLFKYLGSGRYWKYHVKKHGAEYVKTIWYNLFTDKDDLVEFALFFSDELDIVNSKLWANVNPEDGLMGGSNGPCSEEQKAKVAAANKGKPSPYKGKTRGPMSDMHKHNLSTSKKGRIGINFGKKLHPLNDETKQKLSESKKGVPKPQRTKEHCEKIADALRKYHTQKRSL